MDDAQSLAQLFFDLFVGKFFFLDVDDSLDGKSAFAKLRAHGN